MSNDPLFYQTMRFPETLGGDEDPHYITFRPQKVDYGETRHHSNTARFKYSKGGSSNIGRGFFTQISDQIGGQIESIGDAAKKSLDEINGIFKQDSFSAAVGQLGKVVSGRIQIGDFLLSAGITTDNDRAFPQGSISLYLPENLGAQLGIDYNASNLGAITSSTIDALQGGSSEDFVDFASKNGLSVGTAVLADLARSSQAVQNVTAFNQGGVLNPYSYQIFNGVQHRTFNYKFNLVARNPQESKRIKEICDAFIYYALPGRNNDQFANVLSIPVQWQIDYYKLGNKLEFFEQPSACFLQNVNISYNDGANQQLHADGSPVNVGLDLTYVEITPRYRDTLSYENETIKKVSEFFSEERKNPEGGDK